MNPNMNIPQDLIDAVKLLDFELPSDEKLALEAIASPENVTKATVSWLAALVNRKGAKFNWDNITHRGPTNWPIE